MAVDDMITFRTAAPVDIPVLQRLADRIWREHYPGIITQEQIDYMLAMMYASAVIEDEIERQGYRYVIVDDRNEPVGFIAYRRDEQERTVKIGKLYLLPSRQGKGIGRQMLQQVKDDAVRSNAKGVYLFVNKKNRMAIRAYERFGFVKAAEVVTDIGGGFVMDDYRMELVLQHG
jgi:ribosomal protein S18 acetylase RimI-like enzyme